MNILEEIEKELKKANEKYPPFHNLHEAYSVIKEEFEEANENITMLEIFLEEHLWNHCRSSKIDTPKQILATLDDMENYTLKALYELIQTAAMIKKAKILQSK